MRKFPVGQTTTQGLAFKTKLKSFITIVNFGLTEK